MHAALIAEELAIPRVLCPAPRQFFSARPLVSDVKHDDARTRVGLLHERRDAIDAAFAEMEVSAVERLTGEGFAAAERQIDRALDLRYLGQAFELSVPIPAGPLDFGAVAAEFHRSHLATYGHADPSGDVELVNVRIAARGVVEKPAPRSHAGQGNGGHSGTRAVWFGGRERSVDVYERELAPAKDRGPGHLAEFGSPPSSHRLAVPVDGQATCLERA